MTACFLQQLHRFISQHTMIEKGETVLVAVSGGADSLALLYGLHSLRTQLECHLHVAHLNHNLRPDADADAEFVRQHAVRLAVPFSLDKVELPVPSESAGREARYQFYEEIAARIGATKIALGHHQDDTAETVLMHLLRGSGTTGLKGILPVREGRFIRPLVRFTRQEIEAFLASMNLTPRHDATNTNTRYLRNRIRHALLPLLERDYNPNIRVGLSRTAEVLGAESEYLDVAAREAFEKCQTRKHGEDEDSIILDRPRFRQYHVAVQRRMLRHCIAEIHGQITDFYFEHCQAILDLIAGDAPNAVVALPNGLQFRRAYQCLIFERKPVKPEDFAYPLAVPGKTPILSLKAVLTTQVVGVDAAGVPPLPNGKFAAAFDWDAIQLPLTVRNRRPGDRFQPFGVQGTKKLKDFFIDAKVPRAERDRIPLLASGDELVWVIGYTTSEWTKLHAHTRRYLFVRLTR